MTTQFSSGHALLIGVGADLANTVDDAAGLAGILKDEGRCAYPPAQVRLLAGEQATRANVLSALDALAKAATDHSTVLVYYSGHGYQVSGSMGKAYFLLPYGYDVDRLTDTAISGAELVAKLKAIPAQKLLLLLDCCHAGGMSDLKSPGLEFAQAPLPPEAQSLLAQGKGRVVIASSLADEFSFAGKPYSAFTLALIEALSGAGASQKDGYVRVADLALYTREMVPQRTKQRQHPILHFEQADNFALAYYAGGDTQPKGLPFSPPPEIEPEPGAWSGFNQQGETVRGNQTNIAGNVQGPVLSGSFQGPVQVGNRNVTRPTQSTTDQSGGVNIQDSTVHVEGDIVGRDKREKNIRVGNITNATGIAIGDGARAMVTAASPPLTGGAEEIAQAFTRIMQAVRAMPAGAEKDEATDAVKKLEAEARKGDQANAGAVRRWLNFLAETSAAAWEVALSTFTHPVAGLSTVFRKVAERAKEEKGKQ
jgi:hypothetical protein